MRRHGVNGFAAAVAALFAATVSACVGGGAANGAGVPAGSVIVNVAPLQTLYAAGQPMLVQIAVENRGIEPLALHNSLLFGAGLAATAADGTRRQSTERNAPGAAQQPMLLPTGGTLAATVDIAPFFPDLCDQTGKLTLELTVAGVASAPLELEIRRDWTGFGARLTTDHGVIDLELDAERAPLTVANFLELADAGFYDGQSFHRVVKGFMIQGGCPNGDGSGDGPRTLPLEAGRGEGARKHLRGTIAMAHKADPDSGSCQFFLCHRDQPALNGNYAAFGQVVRGLEVIDAIAEEPCAIVPGGPDAGPSKPKQRVKIESIRPLPPEEMKPAESGAGR